MQMLRMLVFLLVVTGGFTLSGLIGFGANVLSMPILSLFFSNTRFGPDFGRHFFHQCRISRCRK